MPRQKDVTELRQFFQCTIFEIQNLSNSFQIKQIISHSIRLNFSVKLVNVMCHS